MFPLQLLYEYDETGAPKVMLGQSPYFDRFVLQDGSIEGRYSCDG